MRIRSLGFVLFLLLFGIPLNAQFAGGTGTVEDPYLVATVAQLNQVRNHLSAHFRQTAEINLAVPPYYEGTGWTPIGTLSDSFTGSYDGDHFQIWGLFMHKTGGWNGLFGVVSHADIRNISVWAADVFSDYQAAIIVGYLHYSSLSNCEVHCSKVSGYDFTGGLVSSAFASQISGCLAEIYIEGWESVGGIVALLTRSTIQNCVVESLAYNGFYQAGGVVGTAESGSSVIDCHFQGNLNASSWVGGIVGHATDTRIIGCTTGQGLMMAGDRCGGIVGDAYARVELVNCSSAMELRTHYTVGGLVGALDRGSSAQNCHASGNVRTNFPAGGFVGGMSNSVISNCYSTGTVTGTRVSGGFAGSISTTGSFVQNCYSTGPVTSIDDEPGGFAGSASAANVVNCYWDLQSSGCPASAAGEGRNTSQMQYPGDLNTYVNWDFESIWAWEGEPLSGYPALRILPVSNTDPQAPAVTDLAIRVYPNPFTGGTQINFDLAKAGKCSIKIYDLKGRLLRRLTESHLSSGTHQFSFDGCDDNGDPLCSGIYFIALQQGGRRNVRRITVLR